MSTVKEFQKALTWFRQQMRKRRVPGEHPSHLVSKVLLEAEKKFDLGTFGVEGWCDRAGRNGVSYLNAGDTYATTIVVRTTPNTHRATVGCWGDAVK